MFTVTSAVGYRTHREADKTHRFSPVSINPPLLQARHLHAAITGRGKKRAKNGNLPKSKALSVIAEKLDKKVLSILENPSQLRRIVAGDPGSEPREVNVGFVVDEVALGQVLLRLLRFSHVSIITLTLHIRPHLQNYSQQTDKR